MPLCTVPRVISKRPVNDGCPRFRFVCKIMGCGRLLSLLLAVWYLLRCHVSATLTHNNGFDSINNAKSNPWEGSSVPKMPISSVQGSFSSLLSHTADDIETTLAGFYTPQVADSFNSTLNSRPESHPERIQSTPNLDMRVRDMQHQDAINQDINTPQLPPEFLFYQTSNGDIFGPFPYQQIIEWFYAGHFSDALLVSQDPHIYSFSPLSEFLFSFDPYYSQQQQHLYQNHFLYYNQDPFHQSSLIDQMKKTSSQWSNWIASKAQQSTSTLALQDTATQVSSLLQESSDRMKKAMEWSNMKRKAFNLIPKRLKTLLPLNTRSRYQDAHLDALWSKRNRHQTPKQHIIDPSPTIETQNAPINDEAMEEIVDIGEIELFQFSNQNNSLACEDDLAFPGQENATSDDNFGINIEAEKSIFGDSYRKNNNAINKIHSYNDNNFDSATVHTPRQSRRVLKALSSFLPSLPKVRNKATGKGNMGDGNVLQIWEMTDKHPALSSSLSMCPTPTLSHTESLSKKLFMFFICLVQIVSWVVLFQGIVTEVDWVIWASRYEDVLHRLLVVDFQDPVVYQYIMGTVFGKIRESIQSPGDNICMMVELWIETVRSWFVHTDNIAMFGVVISTVIMSVVNGSLWPNITFLSVFGFLILCLSTKVLSSLELTAGLAALSVGGGMSVDRSATPGQVLIMRIVSVMQQMKLLWCTSLLTVGIHYLQKKTNH